MPDYKAILTGQSWNAAPTLSGPAKPVFLTYTFQPLSVWPWGGDEVFTSADRQVARTALKTWGNASGITFLEASGPDAEIRFHWEEADDSVTAWAKFPDFQAYGAVRERDATGGQVNLNTVYRDTLNANGSYKLYILLHEIGHALGLKHPFHTSPYNRQLLGDSLDDVSHTVMAYDGGDPDMTRIGLGDLDKQAIQDLYGQPSQDGHQIVKWGWDAHKQLLSQAGGPRNETILGVAVKDLIRGLKGNDRIYGFDGNDTLAGGLGNDIIAGGDGSDQYRFDTTLSARKNIDRIVDFNSAYDDDQIGLSHKIFKGLAKGQLAERLFASEGVERPRHEDLFDWDDDDWDASPTAVPVTEATRIIFNETTRYLSYDADGSGPLGRIQFAKVIGTVSLVASDFFII